MWIDNWSWSKSWSSGSRNASAGAATRITTSSCVTAGLALENLSEQTARTLCTADTAIATSSSTAARIASSYFSAARRTTTDRAVSATASNFSTAAWSSDFATAGWGNLSSVLSSQTCMQVCSSVVDLVHLLDVSCVKFALQTLETVQNWGAANRSRTASAGFNAAAWSSNTTVVPCTWIASSGDFSTAAWSTLAEQTATGFATTDTSAGSGTSINGWSSDFGTAAWATSATCHFGAAARINNRGVTARALCSNAVSTQQTMNKVAAEALSAKACSQNHRSNKNVQLHLN